MKIPDLLLITAIGAAAYFALFGGEYGLFEARRLERQTGEEIAVLEQLRNEVVALRARADSLADDPATLERIARERYGMIRDGERLYRFARADADPGGKARDPKP